MTLRPISLRGIADGIGVRADTLIAKVAPLLDAQTPDADEATT